MDPVLTLTIGIIAVALIFDFINGFHDAANATATIVATKVLTPRKAVLWAASFNFIALFIFGTGVAKTVGSGLIDLNYITPSVILAGLLGAIIWNLITWWYKMPSSSSHALLGGYAGSAMTYSVLTHSWNEIFTPLLWSGWSKTLLFIVVAPVLGYVLAFIILRITRHFLPASEDKPRKKLYASLQLASSALLSLSHGGNDAQKTAGIIAGVLFTAGYLPEFNLPYWVLCISYIAIALGTLIGGWRIVETLGYKLTELNSKNGFCAESGAALSIILATLLHMPISTTLTTTGAVIGTGASQGTKRVHWPLVQKILLTWAVTLPLAAFSGSLAFLLIQNFL